MLGTMLRCDLRAGLEPTQAAAASTPFLFSTQYRLPGGYAQAPALPFGNLAVRLWLQRPYRYLTTGAADLFLPRARWPHTRRTLS